jgi:hypothetical protein
MTGRGERGTPPYLVRWLDDGHEGLFFPGPGAALRHRAPDGHHSAAE